MTITASAAGCGGEASDADGSPAGTPTEVNSSSTTVTEVVPADSDTTVIPLEPGSSSDSTPQNDPGARSGITSQLVGRSVAGDRIPLLADEPGSLGVTFQTTLRSSLSLEYSEAGNVRSLILDGSEEPTEGMGVFAGYSSPEAEVPVLLSIVELLLPEVDEPVFIVAAGVTDDGATTGVILAVDSSRLAVDAVLLIDEGAIAGGVWSIPPGESAPDRFLPLGEGMLELSAPGTTPGNAIIGSFSGVYGYTPGPVGGENADGEPVEAVDADTAPADLDETTPADADDAAPTDTDDTAPADTTPPNTGLAINEVSARGDPLDWFELHNASSDPITLDGFEMADDLDDVGRRVAFPAGMIIQPGGYIQITLDKEGWPGFALGSDEELGVWSSDGTVVDSVDWVEGQSGEGRSYARIPDATGGFQTVNTPTPGAVNQP